MKMNEFELVSSDKIKEATMKKIQKQIEENNDHASTFNTKRKNTKWINIAASILLIAMVSSGTAYAASGAGSVIEFLQMLRTKSPMDFSIGSEHLSEDELSNLDAVSTDFLDENDEQPSASSNGITVTASQAVFDGHSLLLNLKFVSDGNVTFEKLAKEGYYSIDGYPDFEVSFKGFDGSISGGSIQTKIGEHLYSISETNPHTMELQTYWDFETQKGEAVNLESISFKGLWACETTRNPEKAGTNDEYYYSCREIVNGDFILPLTNLKKVEEKEFETDLGTTVISNIGYHFIDHENFTLEQIDSYLHTRKDMCVTLSDGRVIKDADGNGFWDEIIDVNDVVSMKVTNKENVLQ